MKPASHILLTLTLMHVACDGVIGSFKAPDSCGVCGGDNSTCRIISGIFTRPKLPLGYNVIAQIPAGACNLSISELKDTKNTLALRLSNGSFVINGDWAISYSGDYHAVGTKFTYFRFDANSLETIHSPGPLQEPIDLMVVYEEPNPGIKYQYQMPVRMPIVGALPLKPEFRPFSGENGINNNDIVDTSSNKTFSFGKGIPLIPSKGQSQNPIIRRPRLRKRRTYWKGSGFTECSKTCGGGVKVSTFICVREYNQRPVPSRRCGSVIKPMAKTIRCNVKPCVAQWITEDWSGCSVTCGEGLERRNVLCRQEITPTLTMTVADGACLESIERTRPCHGPPCSLSQTQGRWTAGFWSECSSSCGLGLKTRSVICPSGDCPASTRPASTSSCDNGPCGDVSRRNSSWLSSEWSQKCSVGCGTGVQTRKVFCSRKDLACDFQSRPITSRACSSDKQCGGQWYSGPWSQCTENCGVGKQTRDVVCLARVQSQLVYTAEANCLSYEKPITEQQCHMNQCEPQWFMGEWTQCSQSCSRGVQWREISCLHENNIQSNQCKEEHRPLSYRPCNLMECDVRRGQIPVGEIHRLPVSHSNNTFNRHPRPYSPNHQNPDGGECIDKFYNCHMVVQARLCKYKYYRTSCCNSCRHRLTIVN